jgi:SAM-dependent methyltransferase
MDDKPPTPPSSAGNQGGDANPKPGHSEVYFNASRDFWWNADFVGLMAKRLDWAGRRKVLDVGCGSGHWTRTFVPFLSPTAEITCIDRDPKWSDANATWARALSEGRPTIKIRQADATSLPFADDSFDFVTCQTVLLHLANPQLALAEMLRVLEPGGLLVCVEPDNFAAQWTHTSLSDSQSLDEEAAAFKFVLAQHRGRAARGLGNLSIGGRLPGMFAAAGVAEIQTHRSDKVSASYPPYDTPEQAAMNADAEELYRTSPDLSRETARENYLAGGGTEADFDAHWDAELSGRKRYFDAIRRKEFDCAGGPFMYLVSGIKGRKS